MTTMNHLWTKHKTKLTWSRPYCLSTSTCECPCSVSTCKCPCVKSSCKCPMHSCPLNPRSENDFQSNVFQYFVNYDCKLFTNFVTGKQIITYDGNNK